MMNVPSFSEDMLPRHFPKTTGELHQKTATAPLPTLPGLSLLLDDDNRAIKPEPIRKVEPKKTFEQWKEQHKAIFVDNAITQRKIEKKQVRFETDNSSPGSPNLELSYCEGNVCHNQRQNDYHPHNSHKSRQFDVNEENILPQRCTYKPASPTIFNDKAYNAASETMVQLPHFNRTIRSDSMKENYFHGMNQRIVNNEHRQSVCCQTKHNNCEIVNYNPCGHGMQSNGCVNPGRTVHHSPRNEVQPNTINPYNAQHLKEHLMTDETLLSIMEEQQQHILLQQSQIMMQQKQNMMQQKQIFMLQHQVQQLLLRNGNNPDVSPSKSCPSSICDKPTPRPMSSTIQNLMKTRNETLDVGRNGTTARSSIGVMTSFLGNVNDAMPKGMHQLNEKFATKLTNEKFIENVGGFSAEEYGYKDSMLDKINDAIKNSSIIDYRNNEAADGHAESNRQSDVNIATKALFYETCSTNNGSAKEQKTTDRSFALYMLGMKYDCAQDGEAKNADERNWQSKQTSSGKADQVSVNLSPEVYDYLKRHGLLKQE